MLANTVEGVLPENIDKVIEGLHRHNVDVLSQYLGSAGADDETLARIAGRAFAFTPVLTVDATDSINQAVYGQA